MRSIALVILLALVGASCGDDSGVETTAGGTAVEGTTSPFPEDAFAFAASSDLAVGTERLLVAVARPNGERLASPDIPVSIRAYPEDDEGSALAVQGTFMWAIEGVSGLYAAPVEFHEPGVWLVEVTPTSRGTSLEEFPIQVHLEPATPGPGDPAPLSETATLDDGAIETISTDTDPDPEFYALTVAEAVSNGSPAVIVFATPQFCQTAICGPTLDRIKEVAPSYPGVDFVHVEVFTNLDDPEALEPVQAVIEWGLPTEPWVFVVDADGIVTARFEGLVTAEELADSLSFG